MPWTIIIKCNNKLAITMAITIKNEPTEHEPQVGGDHRLNTILRVLQSIEYRQQQYTDTELDKKDCATIVSQLAALQTPPQNDEYKVFCDQILSIQSKLPLLCKNKVVANNMLLAFYQEISTEGKSPSPVLSIVLQLLNPESIQLELQRMRGRKLGAGGLERALMTLCGWLAKWTMTPNLGTLINALFEQLKKQQEHNYILSSVTENYLERLFKVVILSDHGNSVWPVVLQMLTIEHRQFRVLDKVLPRLQMWANAGLFNQIPRTFLARFLELVIEELKRNPYCATFNHTEVYDILRPYENLLKQSEDGSSGSRIAESATASSSYDLVGHQSFISSNGHVGLHNLGNTCYMNSILQALFMTTSFRNDILVNVKEDAVRTSPLLAQLQQLFALLQYSGSWRRTAVEPIGFLSTARPPTFLPGHQHDSSEFLGHLLDSLHEQEQQQVASMAGLATGGGGECTAVGRTFSGRTVTRSRCAVCRAQSEHTDHFRDLQLAFPTTGSASGGGDGTTSVQALLDYYLQPEPLTGDNQYHCSHCSQLTDGERCTRILHPPPPRLLLTLKHFRYDPATQLRTKLLQRVQLDQHIRLDGEGGCLVEYELYAAVVHCGHSLDAGHYYTYAQEGGGENGANREWYKFNDATVTVASPTDLLTIPSPSAAYVLFYRRTDMPEPPRLVPTELPERLRSLLQRDRAEAAAILGGTTSSGAAGSSSSTRRPPPGGGSCGGNGLGTGFSHYVC